MRKIVLALLLAAASLHAIEVDEYKVDLYYANGIMMQDTAEQAEDKWKTRVDDLLSQRPYLQTFIGKTDVAYNISHGVVADMWESFNQATDVDPRFGVGWKAFMLVASSVKYIGKAIDWLEKIQGYASNMIQHDGTLDAQVEKYKKSIKAGHGVVVVAHSQGNLFTAEAFKKLDFWMRPYLHTIAVASPTITVPNHGNGVMFDNDIIHYLGGAGTVATNLRVRN